MRNTTLCYIERGEQYLMLHRVKKEHDLNHDKWVGIGGKFEADETPDECLLREAYEETGLTLTDWRCRGVVTFLSDEWEGEYMYLFKPDLLCKGQALFKIGFCFFMKAGHHVRSQSGTRECGTQLAAKVCIFIRRVVAVHGF